LCYQIAQILFRHPAFVKALGNRLDDLCKRSLSENRCFEEFQRGGFRSSPLALRGFRDRVDCIRVSASRTKLSIGPPLIKPSTAVQFSTDDSRWKSEVGGQRSEVRKIHAVEL
jgi:hypothetical protein